MEIVYVCSPDFWPYLCLSLRTLLTSGTTFSQVTIFVVGGALPRSIHVKDVHVRTVSDISDGYWLINKSYLSSAQSERIAFLDVDTVVLRPLQEIWQNTDADLIARYDVGICNGAIKDERWQEQLSQMGLRPYPLLSSGFMIFQNYSHHRIGESVRRFTNDILSGSTPLRPTRFAELQAFTLAAAYHDLTTHLMEAHQHRYAMLGEPYEDAVVCHFGTPRFYWHYRRIEAQYRERWRNVQGVPRPRAIMLRDVYVRGMHRLRTKMRGARDLIPQSRRPERQHTTALPPRSTCLGDVNDQAASEVEKKWHSGQR